MTLENHVETANQDRGVISSTTAPTIEQELAELGVTHRKSKIVGCRDLYNDRGDYIDSMDAHFASHFIDCARSAA